MNDLISRFKMRLDLHQSPAHAMVMKKIGWSVEGDPGTQIYYRTLGPLTVAKYQRGSQIDIERIKEFRKRHKTLTTYIEPGIGFRYDLGFSVEPFAHSTTSILDLTPSRTTLLSKFSQKTRYNIVKTQKNHKLMITSTPLPHLTNRQRTSFLSLHSEWSKRKNVIGYSQELLNAILSSYDNNSFLLLASDQQDNLQAALLILCNDGVATYYAAFSTQAGYALYAPTLLTYHALIQAKKNHCDIFDFGGIYDERYPRMYKKWIGFTRFKAGFNPTTIQYPPTKLQLFW